MLRAIEVLSSEGAPQKAGEETGPCDACMRYGHSTPCIRCANNNPPPDATWTRGAPPPPVRRSPSPSTPVTECSHPGVWGGNCNACGAPVAFNGHRPGCHASGLGPPSRDVGCGCPSTPTPEEVERAEVFAQPFGEVPPKAMHAYIDNQCALCGYRHSEGWSPGLDSGPCPAAPPVQQRAPSPSQADLDRAETPNPFEGAPKTAEECPATYVGDVTPLRCTLPRRHGGMHHVVTSYGTDVQFGPVYPEDDPPAPTPPTIPDPPSLDLRDEVAMRVYAALSRSLDRGTGPALATLAFDAADAFIAERGRRGK